MVQPPTQQQAYGAQQMAPVITTGQWMLNYLISIIPVVNVIMWFVWGFNAAENPTKSNWAKAMLIWTAILIGLWIIFAIVMAIIVAAVGSSMQNSF